MISECLEGLYDKTDLENFYNQESPNKLPSLIICKDRYQKQNQSYSNYLLDNNNNKNDKNDNENNNNNYRNNNKPIYIRNQTNTSGLYNGFSENIDIDSELKQINHINDNCYYDNYKMKHKDNTSLNKHYDKIFKPQKERLDNIKSRKLNELNFIDENCIYLNDTSKSFKECNVKSTMNSPYPNDNKSKLLMGSKPVYYQFHNDKYIDFYPCESLFNNFTKRGGIPNTVNRNILNCKK